VTSWSSFSTVMATTSTAIARATRRWVSAAHHARDLLLGGFHH
jgi:hypothetical protein